MLCGEKKGSDMLGRITAVVCRVIGVCVVFNVPHLFLHDFSNYSAYAAAEKSIRMTFYGIAGGCAFFGVILWELGTCAMRLTQIAGRAIPQEEPKVEGKMTKEVEKETKQVGA